MNKLLWLKQFLYRRAHHPGGTQGRNPQHHTMSLDRRGETPTAVAGTVTRSEATQHSDRTLEAVRDPWSTGICLVYKVKALIN
jgi:hypothetical protein